MPPERSDGINPIGDNRQFFQGCLIAVVAIILYSVWTSKADDIINIYQGAGMILLATLPALQWARKATGDFPVFEIFMLTAINTYALPLLNGHTDLQYYSNSVITTAGWAVLFFQTSAVMAFNVTTGKAGRSRFWVEDAMSKQLERYLGYGLLLNTAYTVVSTYYAAIPSDLLGILRAVFFGIGIVCTFVQSRRWGQGLLPPQEKIFFLVNSTVQIVVLISGLFLVSGVSILILGLLGYISGGRKIPIIFCAVSFGCIGVLFNGKAAMREKYWDPTTTEFKTSLSPTNLPAFYSEWIQQGLSKAENSDSKRSTKLVERTSLFHILCLVAALSPDRLPFLNGETYAQIPGQFVPRFFWPEKPPGHISTYTLAIYYGLQRREDTIKTTIGFGMVTEAYANFGFFGVGGLGALIGFSLKKVRCWSTNSPLLSYGGLLLVILMAWSFQTEFTMSIWLSSFFQACVCVLGIPLIIRSFLS